MKGHDMILEAAQVKKNVCLKNKQHSTFYSEKDLLPHLIIFIFGLVACQSFLV